MALLEWREPDFDTTVPLEEGSIVVRKKELCVAVSSIKIGRNS
jgi:hypothetical protein